MCHDGWVFRNLVTMQEQIVDKYITYFKQIVHYALLLINEHNLCRLDAYIYTITGRLMYIQENNQERSRTM